MNSFDWITFGGLGIFLIMFVVGYRWGVRRKARLAEERQEILRKVDALPIPAPQIMRMHFTGYNYLEIAGQLGLPNEFVRREIKRSFVTLLLRPEENTKTRKRRRPGFLLRSYCAYFLLR